MGRANRSNDDELMMALDHPLRRSILRLMADGETTSPVDLAEALDHPVPNLAYHVRVLAKCKAVKLVGTARVRGATQHFYTTAVDAPWALRILGLDHRENGSPGESSGDRST
jgi:DNA-binding transcriptional ArsR family regulator